MSTSTVNDRSLAQVEPTFSCRRCFSSFNSRYVRFDRTGVLNGFMIFLTATGWPVNWSLAELFPPKWSCQPPCFCHPTFRRSGESRETYQTSPKAPIPTGCRSEYLIDGQFPRPCADLRLGSGREKRVPAGYLKGGAEDLSTYEFRHIGGRRSHSRSNGVAKRWQAGTLLNLSC